jgi:hypothetical protein
VDHEEVDCGEEEDELAEEQKQVALHNQQWGLEALFPTLSWILVGLLGVLLVVEGAEHPTEKVEH